MRDFEEFEQVPGDELVDLGVQEVMRTPADGVDRNDWMRWETARLAVSAMFINDGEADLPVHQLVVENADGKGNSVAFSSELLEDGTYNVATVSGWHREGRAKLSPLQSEAFSKLIQKSIEAGPRRYS